MLMILFLHFYSKEGETGAKQKYMLFLESFPKIYSPLFLNVSIFLSYNSTTCMSLSNDIFFNLQPFLIFRRCNSHQPSLKKALYQSGLHLGKSLQTHNGNFFFFFLGFTVQFVMTPEIQSSKCAVRDHWFA